MREADGDDVTLDVLIEWASDPSRCLSFPRFDPICAARDGYPTEEWCWPCTARTVLGVICELGFAALAERSLEPTP